jgi:hypothetical protein
MRLKKKSLNLHIRMDEEPVTLLKIPLLNQAVVAVYNEQGPYCLIDHSYNSTLKEALLMMTLAYQISIFEEALT